MSDEPNKIKFDFLRGGSATGLRGIDAFFKLSLAALVVFGLIAGLAITLIFMKGGVIAIPFTWVARIRGP